MHEETRRRLRLAAFVVICLLPTCATMGLAVYRALPVSAHQLADQLSLSLGVDVRISRLCTPRPQQVRLENVYFESPVDQRPLAVAPVVNAQRADDQRYRLEIPKLKIFPGQLPTAWRTLHHRLLQSGIIDRQIVSVHFDEIELRGAERAVRWVDVDWTPSTTANSGHESTLQFAIDEAGGPKCAIHLERRQNKSGDETVVTLDTQGHAVPLPDILAVANLAEHAKAKGSLKGTLQVAQRRGTWDAAFKGSLLDLELSQLAESWVPHQLSGQVSLAVNRARFDAAGLRDLDGRLRITHFVCPSSMMAGLLKYELFTAGPAFARYANLEEFVADKVELEFLSVNELGVTCRGVPDQAGIAIAAEYQGDILLLCDSNIHAEGLLRAIIPRSAPESYKTAARWQRLLPPTVPRLE